MKDFTPSLAEVNNIGPTWISRQFIIVQPICDRCAQNKCCFDNRKRLISGRFAGVTIWLEGPLICYLSILYLAERYAISFARICFPSQDSVFCVRLSPRVHNKQWSIFEGELANLLITMFLKDCNITILFKRKTGYRGVLVDIWFVIRMGSSSCTPIWVIIDDATVKITHTVLMIG